ncbi:MAG: T9SS type A sorting domain-containing protein [Ignavibacteriaceae bacterium]|nr:T9SS type A sorting domain-containing protein [Ignavibacterium sp.]MCC6256639.1 T9SS type A sorting domain-containing protein [Ignavibacteriaceae bacterium]
MAKFIAILFIAFSAIPYTSAKSSKYISLSNQSLTSIETQGGVLEFKSSISQRFDNTTNNCDTVILSDYSGQPLKALQLKIIVTNGRKLKLRSISRGSSIPASSFLFDYQIYRGVINEDGTSIDQVNVVLLGNGENVLYPKQSHNILTIEYDIASIENDLDTVSIILTEILGATCMPVQDANISSGSEKTLFLKKSKNTVENNIVLQQNFPNPFNPTTSIQYSVSSSQFVSLKIYDVLGNEIETLVNEEKTVGSYKVDWNASELPSGVYLYRVNTGRSNLLRKMILMR